jgi:hypothetical protein
MAGRLSGVAARIQETNEKALYVHCNSHRLNLWVAACCKEQLIWNIMEHVRVASEFFTFPQNVLICWWRPSKKCFLTRIINDWSMFAKQDGWRELMVCLFLSRFFLLLTNNIIIWSTCYSDRWNSRAGDKRCLNVLAQNKNIQKCNFHYKTVRRFFTEIAGGHVLSKCPKERHSPLWNIKFHYVFGGVTASL